MVDQLKIMLVGCLLVCGGKGGGDMIFPPKVASAQAFINMVAHLGSERRYAQLKPIASPPVSNSVI